MKRFNDFARRSVSALFAGLILTMIFAASAIAQTTAFTYQGQLNDGTSAAAGTYNMQFSLFDAATNGNQVGATITNTTVSVVNGIFTVQLDFSASTPFSNGANRFLQIAVKKPADTGYTTLTPRQQMTSSPYSIRTINAGTSDALSTACVGCVTNAQIAAVDGSKVTGSTVTGINASNISSGTVADGRLSSNVTLAGNTFNGANQLVKLDANTKLPAIDGSQLTNIAASSGGIVVFPVSNGNTYAIGTGVGTSATRSFFGSFGGSSASGATLTFTLPAASSYPAGTVLRVYLTDYITGAPTVLFQRSGSTDLLHGFNQGSGMAGPANFGGALSSWTTDGVGNWYRAA